MTNSNNAYLKYKGYHMTACKILEYIGKNELKENTIRTAAFRIFQYLTSANDIFQTLTVDQHAFSKNDPTITQLDYQLLLPILRLYKTDFFRYYVSNSADWNQLIKYREDCEKLRVRIKQLEIEKYERWQELQTLRKEKGERWHELQALKKEKGERWHELQALKKEKGERWYVMQDLKRKNSELSTKLKQSEEENKKIITSHAYKFACIIAKIVSPFKYIINFVNH